MSVLRRSQRLLLARKGGRAELGLGARQKYGDTGPRTIEISACGLSAEGGVRECHPKSRRSGTRLAAGAVTVSVVARRVVLLGVMCVIGVMLTGAARSNASRGTCGPALCFHQESGWFGSVGPGVVNGRPAAWVLFGNFPFPAGAAGQEGTPPVPPGKVLVWLGDWPVVRPYDRWRRVRRLRLPRDVAGKRVVRWHVRFGGRAVFVAVRFGSAPIRRMRNLANAHLMGVYRKG